MDDEREYDGDIALCRCGCRQPAPLYAQTRKAKGQIAGQPADFVKGHNATKPLTPYETGELIKLCECGCGQELKPSVRPRAGVKKGEVGRFISGHNTTRGECELRDGERWKKCNTCKTWKPVLSDYYPKSDSVWGMGYCKLCQRKYQERNVEAIKEYNQSRRWRRWGFTDASIIEYYDQINRECEICSTPKALYDLVFDHDHETDVFRGLLCGGCNLGIGHFKENQDALEVAIKYLGRHKNK